MLTQVIGRAGRGAAGPAIIQTMTPDNAVLQLAARQDYDGFYAAGDCPAAAAGLPAVWRPFDLPPDVFQEKALAAGGASRRMAQRWMPGLAGQNAPHMLLGPAPAAVARG
ncbi:MAG: hypothetical protein V8S89_04255 [Oscillospiraceae bacterium]